MANEMQEKEVGTIKAMEGASINDSNADNFHLLALAYNKHDSLM